MNFRERVLGEAFDYRSAGAKAPLGVQQEIERFRKLPLAERSKQPLLYYLLGESTPAFKMDMKDAAYQGKPKGKQKCGNCEFAFKKVVQDRFICSQISGDIKPNAWCRLWKAPD